MKTKEKRLDTLIFKMLLAGMSLVARNAACEPLPPDAAPIIHIEVIKEESTGHDQIHAEAEYRIEGFAIIKVIEKLRDYPKLHDWIDKVTPLDAADNSRQEFMVEFRLPWPIGREWSRIEVEVRSGEGISWRQIEGSLAANEGEMMLNYNGEQSRIDYRASISLKSSSSMVRYYIKRFVNDFLVAIGLQARQAMLDTSRVTLQTFDE